ncbi:MAG TPA: Uma2 family endonuclease [Terriglobia bacterium]
MKDFTTETALLYSGGELMSKINKRLFSVDEYMRMAEAGILSPVERVELIQGEILVMSPIGPRHQAVIDRGTQTWVQILGGRAIVRGQGPAVLDRFAAPQPDLALLRPREDFYLHKHPGIDDIFLIIEVSDSSLEYDTTVKQALYAILKIQEYWVADLQNNRLLAYSDPQGDAYRTIREYHRGDSLAPLLLPDCRISVDVFLP